MRRNDAAVAGVVAGLLMLAAIVAFLAYFNSTWVPTYVANKESSHSADLLDAMTSFADTSEDRAARGQTGRTFSQGIPAGVTGIPILGAGASSGEVAVEAGPNMTVSLGTLAGTNRLNAPTTLFTARGAVAAITHTTRYPNQTIRYELGAMETAQSEGSFVDLRNLVHAARSSRSHTDLTIQAMNITGAPQNAGGNAQLTLAGTITSATNTTNAAGDVRLNVGGVSGGAWRLALNRTMGAAGIGGAMSADCNAEASTIHYCYPTQTNTATTMDVFIRNVSSGWTSAISVMAAEVRS